MKCIKNSNNNIIKRINDLEANKMVKSGLWNYCAKSEWKAVGKPTEAPIETDEPVKKPKKAKKTRKAQPVDPSETPVA